MPVAPYVRECQDSHNNRIRKIDLQSGETTTLAGTGIRGFNNGEGTSAHFNRPYGIAIDPEGGFALVAVRALLRASPASPRCACRRQRVHLSHTNVPRPHHILLGW